MGYEREGEHAYVCVHTCVHLDMRARVHLVANMCFCTHVWEILIACTCA